MEFSADGSKITTEGPIFSHNNLKITNNYGGSPLKEKVIKWSLCSAKYKIIHNEAYSSRNHETGEKFFKSCTYKDWVDGEEKNKPNLECVGKPGAGKTSTASAIIEGLLTSLPRSSESWIVLYAYFRHNSQSCQTIPIVFSNFLGQVVDRQSEPSQPIRELYEKCAPHDAIPRLDQVIPILKSEISESKRSYIVVDALDEFSLEDPNASSELVARLEGLGARLLITSRYSINFTPETFSRITVFASDDDLIIYVRGQLASNLRLRKLLKGSLELEQEIIEKICEKCDGMFIIARLLVESISLITTVNQVRDVLKSLPKGLDSTYKLAMDRIDSQSEEFRKLGRRVIQWVTFAKEKLTVAELLHAVCFEPGMEMISEDDLVQEDDMVSACAGLIIISEGYVQFVHFSTQEFFARFADQYFPDAQRTITKTCLRYLALSASAIHPEIEQQVINEVSQYERRCLLQKYITTFPLATHAATHWGSHAFDIQERFDHSLAVKFYHHPVSPYIADTFHVEVRPDRKMDPQHYQILYCARYCLALSLLGLQALPYPCGVDDGIERTYVNLNATRDFRGMRPLHFAAWYGHKAVLSLLIEANADVNVRNKQGRTPLSFAAKGGHSETVELLLSRGADPDTPNIDGQTPLAHAAENGHSEATRMLLDGGADPNIANKYGYTPLACAAHRGYSEAVRVLLDGGADPNIANALRWTPLAYAAQNGDSEAVRMLLDGGADPDTANIDRQTPLAHAAENGRSEAMRMLLDGGADPNANNDGRTPLAYAAEKGHSEAVRMLLDAGADPNIADKYGQTPLAYAAENGRSEAMKMLLDDGVDPNIANKHGRTPLAQAAANGSSEAVRMLLDGRADPNIANKYGYTPLAYAAHRGNSDAVRMLLDGGADPNIANDFRWTPLAYASQNGDSEAVRMLLDGEAGPDTANIDGQTPLAHAAENGRSEALRILLDGGADPNIANKHGRTPLAYAAEKGHSEAVRVLLDGGADPNVAREDGWTPLAYAAQNGHSEAVRILLDGGADPNIANDFGWTPLAHATHNGHSEAVRMLLDGGADPIIANKYGYTPLAYAAHRGHSEAVRMLLNSRADPNIANEDGRTPLSFAVGNGHSEAVRMLLDGGADPDTVNRYGPTPLAIAEHNGYTDIAKMIRGYKEGRSSK